MSLDPDQLEALRVLGHELRRPLTVIRGAATMLLEDGDALPPDGRRQMLELLENGVESMNDLIDDLSTAVHLQTGDLGLSLEPLDPAPVVAEAVAAARRQEPGRRIEVRCPPGLELEADRVQAVRVLRALIVNALRFSPSAAPVEVVARPEPGRVRIEVLDRGPGIPADDRERAFEPFTRLDHRAGGPGLGLFLARGLARAMGGEVGILDRDGGGCAVWVTLSGRG
ncbi:MAG TPA: ATP-binding protein [Candidatus Dormibacteraeota bacterium]|jgi:two-component system sensor histidine kinase KdpD|nr:ATP-binding protein [Candidatus Dormibacteraeota bacterium]